jgi:maltose O-acetyltransferase
VDIREKLLNTVATSELMPFRLRPAMLRRWGVEIGDSDVHSDQRFKPGVIRIGNRVLINRGCYFEPGSASIDIADGVALGVGVTLTAVSHEIGPSENRAGSVTSAPISIGRGAWLGARVIVLPGVTVAPGCIIGAGAVVTRSTEPDGVYAGTPARRVRTLPQH